MKFLISMLVRASMIVAILTSSTHGYSQNDQDQDINRILFIGNSYTYFWNLPQVLQAMSKDQWMVRQSTAGGASWSDHLEGEKELTTLEILSEQEWDIVVLQNHSRSTLDSLQGFLSDGLKLIRMVREVGAEPILYNTWARQFNPLMQQTINEGYDSLSSQSGVVSVPVGKIWEYVRYLRPELQLHDPDNSHPSPSGTYLTACIFYKFFSGEDSLDLPNRIIARDKDGEKLYLLILPASDAEFLQEAVDFYFEDNQIKWNNG